MSVATWLRPTWCTLPDWDYTLGPEVAQLCAAAGFAPDEPQKAILDAVFAIKDGLPAAFEIGIVAPRQNLKTGVLKQIGLGWSFLLGRSLVVWSAHEVSTSTASFRDLSSLIEENDFLDRRVQRLYRPEGRERIELRGGAEIRFKARTRSGGRGLSGDDTVLDEAFALKGSHLGALLPVMLTRPHAQVIYASSAGLADSDVLRSVRERGRRGDHRLAYFEYGDSRPREGCALDGCDHAITRTGCVLDDRSRWWATNPTLGVRITEEGIANLRRSLPPEEFAREVLGWWDDPGDADAAIPITEWLDTADHLGAGRDLDSWRVAIDMPPDRRSSSILACARRDDQTPQLEVIDVAPGSEWVIPRLVDIKRRRRIREVVISAQSAAVSLVDALTLEGFRVTVASTRDYAAGCGVLHDAVHDHAVRHVPHDALTNAVLEARKKALADFWILDKRNAQGDISPLVAAVLAHWAVTRTRPRKTDAELIAGMG